MRKLVLLLLCAAVCLIGTDMARSQDASYRTILLAGTADTIIDSSLTSAYMNGVRIYINNISWYYSNAANTNRLFVEVIRGQTAMATAGSGRQFKYDELMTSSGVKSVSMPVNITTGPDSTIYFMISAASSDSLMMAVTYKFVGR